VIEPTIVVAGIGAIPASIAALAAWRSHLKVRATHYEITNDHKSNIRHDIDDLAKAVRDGFNETRKDIGGLREELRTERIERIEGDRLRVVYNVGG